MEKQVELNYEYTKPQGKLPVKKVSFHSEPSVEEYKGTYIQGGEITVIRDGKCMEGDDVVFDIKRRDQEIYLNRSSIVALHKIFGDIIDGEGWERL